MGKYTYKIACTGVHNQITHGLFKQENFVVLSLAYVRAVAYA